MPILTFPSNPGLNQEYTKGSLTWRWDGSRWRIIRTFTVDQQSVIESALNSVIADVEDALQFKGTIGSVSEDGATVGVLPTEHGVGWTFKVVTPGTYAGKVAEIGDMIVSVVSRANTGNTDADWAVIQKNIDFSSFAYDIIPAQDETINIGSASKKFNELYLSGNTIYIGNKTISVDPEDGAITFPAGTPLKLGDNMIDIDEEGDLRFTARTVEMVEGSPVTTIQNRGIRIGNVRIGDDDGSFAIRSAVTGTVTGISSLGAIRQRVITGTTTHTLGMDDAGTVVEIENSSAVVVTIPNDSAVDFPDGTEIAILRLGSGALSVAPASGVTLVSDDNKRKIKSRYTGGAIRKLSANKWILIGNLET